MKQQWARRGRAAVSILTIAGASIVRHSRRWRRAMLGYHPIDPTEAGQDRHPDRPRPDDRSGLAVARYGAKVQLAPRRNSAQEDNYGLLLEAPPRACRSTVQPRRGRSAKS